MAKNDTLARHTKHKSPHPALQLFKGFMVIFTVVILAAIGVVGFTVWDTYQRFTSNSVALPSDGVALVPPTLSFDSYAGEVTFLLTGTDECEEEFSHIFGDRCDGSETGARNDVTLLVHVPEDHSKATIISFPRDLMMTMPSCVNESGVRVSGAAYQQLNTAYDRAGLSCVASAVEELSGMQIPFAAKISWGGVITITDQLGGVDVCVANGIYDYHTGLALDPGTHTLQGVEALQFLRTRHGLSGGSDLARIGNQQLYMAALTKKIMGDGTLEDLFGLLGVSRTIVDNVEHSSSLNEPTTLVSLALLLRDLDLSEITFLQLPTVTDPENPNRVIEDGSQSEAFWNAVRNAEEIGLAPEEPGVIKQEPEETPTPEATPSTAPVATVPGLRADSNVCSNGAG